MVDIRHRLDELEQLRKQTSEKLTQSRAAAQAEVARRRREGRGKNVTNIRRPVRHPLTEPESDGD